MKFENLKIGTQLKLGFATLLLFVIVLGVVSYQQSNKINDQVEFMYNHPILVRSAIGSLTTDILDMRLGNRDLMLAKTDMEKQEAILLMNLSAEDAVKQFSVLKTQYLGPPSDVHEAYNAFLKWEIEREENTKLALSGEIEKVKKSVHATGNVGVLRNQMLAKIQKIDNFAKTKSETLLTDSNILSDLLNRDLILLVAAILLLSLGINFILYRNIRKPLVELTEANRRFRNGEMEVRSSYESKNEFGALSDSFNMLAEHVQMSTTISEKSTHLAGIMLSEDDATRFFYSTLNALLLYTGSQMAAAYLLREDKKRFEHFESIGLDENARQSFSATNFDGEFGTALASRKIQHLKNIHDDTRFVFNTTSGKFIPHEIVTIPITSGNEVIALFSIASVSSFSDESIQLIYNIFDMLSARIEGILAYRKVKEFSQKMGQQNRELEVQAAELASQSAELMEQNTELETQKKQLNESNRVKTNFLSNMSHELRTPLNSVIALAGVLNRRLAKVIPEEEYSYLEIIERNGKHLLTLINDILDISRIEAGREEIEVTKFDMNGLIADVVSMIQPQAGQKNIELHMATIQPDLYAVSDAGKCRHIVQNLVSNAVKFTETGTVQITAIENGDKITIKVSDTGIGISESNQMHIFDEFRQADSSTSRKYGGTGLGLAIARKYANLIGGTISVSSILGEGSEFTFILPIQYDETNMLSEIGTTTGIGNQNDRPVYPAVSASNNKTILLVEDSEPAIIQMKDILESYGYKLLVARNGNEGLSIISQTIPDAMILDLMMPGIDGFQVLKTIREAKPTAHIPVLILTAKQIMKDELRFLKQNNVHQLIQKGDINRSALLGAIASMTHVVTKNEILPAHVAHAFNGKPVVLVVEDNADNLTTVKALLGDNYLVIEATDGQTAIEMAKKHKPDLILMDIALPGVDGIHAFKTIRNDAALQHIAVIALTASAMTSDRETILAHGFDAYIAKPIEEMMFLKTINSILYGS